MSLLDRRFPRDLALSRQNLGDKIRRKPIADLRYMPRELVERTESFSLYRYMPAEDVEQRGEPLFIIPPLAAPAIAFDLRRGCSLIEYFIEQGRPVYLVDYGPVNFSHRDLGIEHWVDTVIPKSASLAFEHSGARGLHATGWSLGGIFTIFTAAAHPELPFISATAVASPFDLHAVPLLAIARPINRLGVGVVKSTYRLAGGIPAPLTKLGFQLSSIDKYLTKPITMLTHSDDRDFLAQLEAVDRFMGNMYAYPGRTFGQLYHVFMRTNEFATGTMQLGGRPVALANVKIPALVVAGLNDTLAPLAAVEHLIDLLTGSPDIQLVTAPGGHLGVLTGRAARRTSWPAMENFFTKHDVAPG